jgi:hypothetical protein
MDAGRPRFLPSGTLGGHTYPYSLSVFSLSLIVVSRSNYLLMR